LARSRDARIVASSSLSVNCTCSSVNRNRAVMGRARPVPEQHIRLSGSAMCAVTPSMTHHASATILLIIAMITWRYGRCLPISGGMSGSGPVGRGRRGLRRRRVTAAGKAVNPCSCRHWHRSSRRSRSLLRPTPGNPRRSPCPSGSRAVRSGCPRASSG
jgi:hypothetical protein